MATPFDFLTDDKPTYWSGGRTGRREDGEYAVREHRHVFKTSPDNRYVQVCNCGDTYIDYDLRNF